MSSLLGKCAAVTGSTSGIGKAIATITGAALPVDGSWFAR